jgi:hypothetical protein
MKDDITIYLYLKKYFTNFENITFMSYYENKWKTHLIM